MKSTNPITYTYIFNGCAIDITRRHVGTAYARNGNVGNPTEYFVWEARVDGERIGGQHERRAEAYEHARASILGIRYVNDDRRKRWVNVRSYRVVEDEMRQLYRGRVNDAYLKGDTEVST